MNTKCYIISFDSSSNSEKIINVIKSFGAWAKITQKNWAIVTISTAAEVRDKIKGVTDTNDRLFVVKSGAEAAWNNVECSSEWLKKNL